MAELKEMPPLVERVVAAVVVTYRTVQENYAGKIEEVPGTAARGETIKVPKPEAAVLDSLNALAPEGWNAGDVELAIEKQRQFVEETIRRGVNPTEGMPSLLELGPVTVSPPGLGAQPQGFRLTAGDTGMEPLQPPAVPPRGPYEAETGAEPIPQEVADLAPRGSDIAQASSGKSAAELRQGGGEGGAFDARGKSLSEVESWIREQRPTAPQTVAAAKGDAPTAETVLEAEKLAQGGDPRATVEGPLQKVIDSEGSGSEESQ